MNLMSSLFHNGHQHKPKNSYDFGQVLGQGGFGIVSKAHDKSNDTDVAIKKVYKKSVKNRDSYKNLLNFMRDEMKHPNTITLIEWFSSSTSYYLVFELATGGDLIDRIINSGGHLSELESKKAVKSILKATEYLHSKNVLHRDIKLDNYLFKSSKSPANEIILIDFGQAVILPRNDITLVEMCGSPTYIAPEIYNHTGYSFPIDLWSIGIITFNLLSGRSLYSSTDPIIIKKETIEFKNVIFKDEFWHDISDNAKDFIVNLLKRDPKDRMSASEALNHDWIKDKREVLIEKKKTNETLTQEHAPINRVVESSRTLRLEEGYEPSELLEMNDDEICGGSTPIIVSGSATPLPKEGVLAKEKPNGDKVLMPMHLHKKLTKVATDDK